MRIVATALLASVALATPALAQDAAAPGPFTGAHVEVTTGVDRVRGGGTGETGLTYGISGGYDIQTASGALFGIEAEAADSTAKDCDNAVLVAGDRACFKAKRDLSVGGRAGFVSGNTLIYGKAGYTNARIGASYEDGTAATAADFNAARNLDGVRVGGGLETNVGNFLVKAEYRYSNYEDGITRHQGVVGVGVRF